MREKSLPPPLPATTSLPDHWGTHDASRTDALQHKADRSRQSYKSRMGFLRHLATAAELVGLHYPQRESSHRRLRGEGTVHTTLPMPHRLKWLGRRQGNKIRGNIVVSEVLAPSIIYSLSSQTTVSKLQRELLEKLFLLFFK